MYIHTYVYDDVYVGNNIYGRINNLINIQYTYIHTYTYKDTYVYS